MDLDLLEEGSHLFSYTPADEVYKNRWTLRRCIKDATTGNRMNVSLEFFQNGKQFLIHTIELSVKVPCYTQELYF